MRENRARGRQRIRDTGRRWGGGKSYRGDERRLEGKKKEEVSKGEGPGCSEREGGEENQIFVSFPRP